MVSFSKLATTTVSCLIASVYAGTDCIEIKGNYYCNQVSQVVYKNIGFQGSYNQVTNFDTDSCSCDSTPVSFSGSLSPLNEELSVHFRGPLNLKQFAHYTLVDSNPSRKKKRAHVHHAHKRDEIAQVTHYVSLTTTVYEGLTPTAQAPASQDTVAAAAAVEEDTTVVTVESTETSAAESTSTSGSPVFSAIQSVVSQVVSAVISKPQTSSSSSSSSQVDGSSATATPTTSASVASSASSSSSAPAATGSGWARGAYYSAESADSNGLVFLNNMGGTNGSGVWDSCFGNSLSYCNSDGVTGASSATLLNDVTLPSNKEFVIYSDSKCSSGSCGYYRPGTPAFHGFAGNQYRVFLFEFSMPSDSGSTESINADMPAIWLLNAQIPRTLQYGNSKCSCWSSGCGEFDIFEILNSGNNWLTSHLHSGQGSSHPSGSYGGGGTADYIARPTDSTMKAAVVFAGDQITITVLDDDVSFTEFLPADTVTGWISEEQSKNSLVTLAS